MDIDQIDQNKGRLETHMLQLQREGSFLTTLPEPEKQQIFSAYSTEVDLKSLVAKAVAATVDARGSQRKRGAQKGFEAS